MYPLFPAPKGKRFGHNQRHNRMTDSGLRSDAKAEGENGGS